jgi:hypothetical protein
MLGHAERNCDGSATAKTATLHVLLMRAGIGVSNVPGPPIGESIRNDLELRRDEFHNGL